MRMNRERRRLLQSRNIEKSYDVREFSTLERHGSKGSLKFVKRIYINKCVIDGGRCYRQFEERRSQNKRMEGHIEERKI